MNCMRSKPILLLVMAGLVISGPMGCKDDSESKSDPALQDKTAELAGDEESLLQRRDALLKARRKLRDKRNELAAERKRVIESGGDTTEVDQKQAELTQQEESLGAEENELNDEFGKFLKEQRGLLADIANKGDNSARIALREGTVASREQSIASREAKLSERERSLAEREAALAKRERETCGVASMPQIVAAPPPAGTTYRKKDVAPLLQKARRNMAKKGILRSDLPAPAQELEKEATDAMKKGDYGSAHFAAKQLKATVDSIRIDRAFIQAKFNRLSATMKKTPAKDEKKANNLFKEATKQYGDGKYSRANKRLNQIYNLL